MILKNVTEYFEGYDVELIEIDVYESGDYTTKPKKKVCVHAINEGGFNSVGIDAKQLYKALKEYFESER